MKYLLILTLLIPFSCKNASHDNKAGSLDTFHMSNKAQIQISDSEGYRNNSETDTIMINKMNVTTFKNIPKEIEGCACYFYKTIKGKNKEYLMINDFAETAFISVDGKIIAFTQIDSNQQDRIYIYSSGNYKLITRVLNKIDDENETRLEGIMEVYQDEVLKYRSYFVGTCEC
jgi:hypothetical protein